MSKDTENIQAAIIFMCSFHPNPIVEINDVVSVKVKGLFMPALECRAALEQGGTYPVKFPVAALEALNETQLEDLREKLIERINRSFDEYKKSWPAMTEKKDKAAKSLASLKKKKEGTNAPKDEPKEDDVRKEGDS